MSEVSKVVKNTWILYIRMAVTVFMSLYTTRLILSALGATDFGLFNLVGGIISMLAFLNTAMTVATQRFMSFAEGVGDSERQKEIFNVSIILHFIIALLVFLLLEVSGYFLFDLVLKIPVERLETAKLILQFMVISTVFTIISVPYDAVINAHENMLFFAVLGVIEAILKLVVAIFVSISTYDKLTFFGLLTTIIAILLLLIRKIYCHRKYKECQINFRESFNRSTFIEMTSFAGWTFLGASSNTIANYGQGIVLNIFFGPIVNSAQAVTNQVSGQLGVFATNMMKALNPLIDKSEGAGNREKMLKATITGCKISFFLLIPFFVPVLIEMPYIFKVWLKHPPENAIIFCRLYLIRNLIDQLFVSLSYSILAAGNIKRYQIIISVLNISPLIISYFLFKLQFPAYFLYITFIFYSIFSFFITLHFANRICGLSISLYHRQVTFKCLLSLLLVFTFSTIPIFVFQEGFVRLLSVLLLNFIAFLSTLWIIGLTMEEKHTIRKISNSVIKKNFFNIYSFKI